MSKLLTIFTIVQLMSASSAFSKDLSVNKKVVKEVRQGLWYEGVKDKRAPGGGDLKGEAQVTAKVEVPEELVRAMDKISF